MSKGKVLVAMSGGVDSSVAAALLVDQGYEVVGVTMQVWDYSECDIEEGAGTCCSSIDVDDARAVADLVGFPFYVLNCEAKFKSLVIDPFLQAYLDGKTPSPCVNCNTYLKFDHLIQKMRELECDYLATGHYAKIQKSSNGEAAIVTSEDSWKDQTYFLFTLQKDILKHLMFPVGEMTKDEVRKYAQERGLLNARKKDSVGICFVGNKGYSKFIEEHVSQDKLQGGNIRRFPDGEILGTHTGIHNFTYGQRRGLGMSHHEMFFVLEIDPVTRTVWVGEEKHLFKDQMEIVKSNWLDELSEDETVKVKIRFHHPGAQAKIRRTKEGAFVQFETPQRAITPGQAAAVYRDRQLVGGGWIV